MQSLGCGSTVEYDTWERCGCISHFWNSFVYVPCTVFFFFKSFYVFISLYAVAYHSFDISLWRIGEVLAQTLVLHLTQWNDSINLAWSFPWQRFLHRVKGYPRPEFLNTWQKTFLSVACPSLCENNLYLFCLFMNKRHTYGFWKGRLEFGKHQPWQTSPVTK